MKRNTKKTKNKIKDSFEVVNSETSNLKFHYLQPQNLKILGWVGDVFSLVI